MIRFALSPPLPLHDDENGQGYFARLGYFHAGVSAGKFCRYSTVDRFDFRSGRGPFIEAVAALSGVELERLEANTLRQDGDVFHLRGQKLALPVVRRTFARFCPECLRADTDGFSGIAEGARRLRWAWLMRPVVACPIHNVRLTELPAPDPVNAFDLPRLFAQHDVELAHMTSTDALTPGPLQRYVVDRMTARGAGGAWLDGQDIAPAVKACEMLGALIEGGPNAQVINHSEEDWARVGDIGFEVCSSGPDAILDVFGRLRVAGGRTSGRAGPQAAYGFFFNWLKHNARVRDSGLLRDILREAIVENFAIGPGEVILGQEITQRRVHSVNSLSHATGLNRWRLYRLMRKAGMIPETDDAAAFNQWVFPAEEGERLVARVANSVPLNKVQHVLGCSKTQAEVLAQHGLITSVTPIADDQIGQTWGQFNRDDLEAFKDEVFQDTRYHTSESEDFVSLTAAVTGKSSTAKILQWQLGGQLRGTRLLNGVPRLDHLRFDRQAILSLAKDRRGSDLNRVTLVATILGISPKSVKKLLKAKRSGPRLSPAAASSIADLQGTAYVSTAEIERFLSEYITLALVARQVGRHFTSVRRELNKAGIVPATDASSLGARIYRRADVAAFIASQGMQPSVPTNIGKHATSTLFSAIKP
jgi:hypothetical protein